MSASWISKTPGIFESRTSRPESIASSVFENRSVSSSSIRIPSTGESRSSTPLKTLSELVSRSSTAIPSKTPTVESRASTATPNSVFESRSSTATPSKTPSVLESRSSSVVRSKAPSVFEIRSSTVSPTKTVSVFQSQSSTSTPSNGSSGRLSVASIDSLPNFIPSNEANIDDEDWKAYLTAKLFILPLENR